MRNTDNSLAIIGGSGIDTFADWRLLGRKPVDSVYGAPSSDVELYDYKDSKFCFLARHGRPHRIAPHCINYRANLYALHELGVQRVIAINSVGGIATAARAGVVVIPDQIIDYTYAREHTFFADDIAVQHIDFTEPYSRVLRAQLSQAAIDAGAEVVVGGIYGVMQGPRLESAAEIRRLERDGCDIVGMTGMPEAALARELGIDYASLCVVVNAAAGKNIEPLTVASMQAAMATALGDIEKILQIFLTQ